MRQYFDKQINSGNKILFFEYVDAFGNCEMYGCTENDLEEGVALPCKSDFSGYIAGLIPRFKSRYQT